VNVLDEKAGLLCSMKIISKYVKSRKDGFSTSLFGKQEDDYHLPELVA
jgi:hypothetical protein